jgi:hypothetical protein
MLMETPVETRNERGQPVGGFRDLLLETLIGWVVIDHKSFPGSRAAWSDKAVSYCGQLALYREALATLNLPLASLWIHFPVGDGWVRLPLDPTN